jgi:hypothetical protein
MTQIVGFAGKKQSGKNTACNFILAMKLAELGVCVASRLSKSGEVEVRDVFGETNEELEWIPFKSPYVDVDALFENELSNYIKIYGLADTLKDLCVDVLGLTYEQAYGTDKDKNSETSIDWEVIEQIHGQKPSGRSTKMTAREVLQHVGTDIFRKIDPDVWIKSLLRKIEKDSPEVALVCDVRFENEVRALQDNGGFVIGLTRDPYKKSDKHSSELEIEQCLKVCDFVLDNKDITISQQNEKIYYAVEKLENVVTSLVDQSLVVPEGPVEESAKA